MLCMQLGGDIGEQKSGRFGSPLNLPTLADCLEKAALDPRIKGVYFKVPALSRPPPSVALPRAWLLRGAASACTGSVAYCVGRPAGANAELLMQLVVLALCAQMHAAVLAGTCACRRVCWYRNVGAGMRANTYMCVQACKLVHTCACRGAC